MLFQVGKLIGAALVAVFLGISSANALLIGAGQSATIDFDFSGSQAAIDAGTQPLTLTFEMTTSVADQFDDPAGMFSYEYIDLAPAPLIVFGYDATGGVTSLGLLSSSVATADLVGSLRISSLTESIDLIGLTFSAQDFNGVQIIATTALSLPNSVDVQIPGPGILAIFGLGIAALGYSRRKRTA
ncbi:MAG: hypothetical protein ACI9JL_004268 [Paracoccaceae bacterium]|jgi:hypothetical protein